MKALINLIIGLSFILLHTSCSEIFEPSIKNKQVNIIAPADSLTSSTYAVLFWWDPLDNAINYQLQIVSPDFNQISALVLDTVVTVTKFSYSLSPGTYAWRIKAKNGSTETSYITRTLVIDTTGLANQTVLLTSPVSGAYINSFYVPFSWQSIYGAISYTLEVDTITGDFSTLILNKSTSYNSSTVNLGSEGKFMWRVKAKDASNESQYSIVRNFIIDTTKPLPVSSLSSGTSSNRTLSWSASASSDVSKYKLYVFTVPTAGDTSVFSQAYNPREIFPGTSFVFTDGSSGQKIVWKVKAVDFAGNESAFSNYASFVK